MPKRSNLPYQEVYYYHRLILKTLISRYDISAFLAYLSFFLAY